MIKLVRYILADGLTLADGRIEDPESSVRWLLLGRPEEAWRGSANSATNGDMEKSREGAMFSVEKKQK